MEEFECALDDLSESINEVEDIFFVLRKDEDFEDIALLAAMSETQNDEYIDTNEVLDFLRK